jgi:Fe-S-cluster containining protein
MMENQGNHPSHSEQWNGLASVQGYLDFRKQLDEKIAEAWALYHTQMQCKAGCFACCKNDFHISLIEAFILRQVVSELPQELWQQIQKNLFGDDKTYCPLLVNGQCVVYENRPILCRIFGFPVSDGATVATCELNFTQESDMLLTAKHFNTKALAEVTQGLSQLYLQEVDSAVHRSILDKSMLPMVRIEEILKSLNLNFEEPAKPE